MIENILAIDTSTHYLSVALKVGTDTVVRHEHAPRRHGELLLPWLDELFNEAGITAADLDLLVCGVGPGGFTGIRLGVGVLQALAVANDTPVVPVSSLQSLAQRAFDADGLTHVITAQDARMGELYWASFVADEQGLMRLDVAEQVVAPELVEVPALGAWAVVGDGWPVYREALAQRLNGVDVELIEGVVPHASATLKVGLAALEGGGTVSASELLPVYLRGESAWKKQE